MELRTELACLERRRMMLPFARLGQILADTSSLSGDPFELLEELVVAGPLDLIEREAEEVEIRSAVLRIWLDDTGSEPCERSRSQ